MHVFHPPAAIITPPLKGNRPEFPDLHSMKDPRYSTIKGLLKAGAIKQFTDIFVWIPHTVVALDFSTNNARMKKMVADPSLWQLKEIYKLAELIEYDPKKLALLAVDQVEKIKSPGLDKPGDVSV